MFSFKSSKAVFFTPIAIAAVGLFVIAFIGNRLQSGQIPLLKISAFKLVNFTFTMQLYIFPLSIIGLLFLYFYDKSRFHLYFKFHLKSNRNGITNWKLFGPLVLFGFAISTAVYMSTNVIANNGTVNLVFWKLMPLVLLFSFTNAWTEEILSRFVIIAALSEKLSPVTICWISALIFGMPHYFSGGVLSVMVSSLLGWFLAKSVIETESMGWALLIHFF